MSYDADLADRVRDLLVAEPDLGEKRMFGGLAFLVGGHMALAVSREGGLMLRVDPAEGARLLAADPRARPMVMRGKELAGWLRVDVDDLDDAALGAWVERGVAVARSLPPG